MVVIMIGRKRSNRLDRGHVMIAFGDDREVDHHDPVLLHNADEQDDAYQRDQAEVEIEQHQNRKRTDAGGRERREDGDRVDIAFIQDAEDEIHHDQRGQDQQRHC
jgi:hypothetical protein